MAQIEIPFQVRFRQPMLDGREWNEMPKVLDDGDTV